MRADNQLITILTEKEERGSESMKCCQYEFWIGKTNNLIKT